MEPGDPEEGPRAGATVREAVRDAVDVVREHGAGLALVLLATTIPRLLRRVVTGLRVAGWLAVGIGAFALLRPVEFMAFLPYLAGGTLVALGGALLYVGQQVREATSAVRLAEKVVEAWRARGLASTGARE